jgi:hypothetical protein
MHGGKYGTRVLTHIEPETKTPIDTKRRRSDYKAKCS